MAFVLVVAEDFGTYRRGVIISNQAEIDQVRSGEFADRIVMVSDEIIVPPTPTETPSISELITRYQTLLALSQEQSAQLAQAVLTNQEQAAALSAQNATLGLLTETVNLLAEKIENPTGGTPVPPELADDVPLVEDDDVALSTDAGAILVGDVR